MPPLNDSSIPWDCPTIRSVQPIHPPNEFHNKNNNNNLKDVTNNHMVHNVQLPSELVQTSTPSSFESFSLSTSSLDCEELVTPTKEICENYNHFKESPEENNNSKILQKKINKDCKKLQKENKTLKNLPEENNNNVNTIKDYEIKNGNVSSNNSRSDTTDERISYAEIIKCAKPKQSVKAKIITEELKKEPAKSFNIPPSEKVLIKKPNGPFLPNKQFCVFCKKNGEKQSVYRTHVLKDKLMNVICPYLSIYKCPNCGATGANAHTISRCPLVNKYNQFNK